MPVLSSTEPPFPLTFTLVNSLLVVNERVKARFRATWSVDLAINDEIIHTRKSAGKHVLVHRYVKWRLDHLSHRQFQQHLKPISVTPTPVLMQLSFRGQVLISTASGLGSERRIRKASCKEYECHVKNTRSHVHTSLALRSVCHYRSISLWATESLAGRTYKYRHMSVINY